MTTTFVMDEADKDVSFQMDEFRSACLNYQSGMSKESFNPHDAIFGNMRNNIHAANARMHTASSTKLIRLDGNKVVAVAAIAASVIAIAGVLYLAWKEHKQEVAKRAALVKEFDDALRRISKPGFNIKREDGTATTFGKLYINGKPAAQVREALKELTLSSKALTTSEKARCIHVIDKSSNEILRGLDDLDKRVKEYDLDRERQIEMAALRSQANQPRIQTVYHPLYMSQEGLPSVGTIVTAAVLVAPMMVIVWASYRIIMWLMHQFS